MVCIVIGCFWLYLLTYGIISTSCFIEDRRGRDRIVVEFTIIVYHCNSCEFEPCSWWCVLDTTLLIKFVSDLWQVDGFLRVLRFPPPIKLTATIFLNTINQSLTNTVLFIWKRKPWNLIEKIQFHLNNNEIIQKLMLTLFGENMTENCRKNTEHTLMSNISTPLTLS